MRAVKEVENVGLLFATIGALALVIGVEVKVLLEVAPGAERLSSKECHSIIDIMFGHGAVVCSSVNRAELFVGSACGGKDFGMGSVSQQHEVPFEVLVRCVQDVDLDIRMSLDAELGID